MTNSAALSQDNTKEDSGLPDGEPLEWSLEPLDWTNPQGSVDGASRELEAHAPGHADK